MRQRQRGGSGDNKEFSPQINTENADQKRTELSSLLLI
ncbi:hypothetical protein FRUB_04685 [Fimbriiglobus ruber]|uniref:Uncharacterized protein n=1 Tax=Fimbriiglobus ruber TaxID=1908690 RepID=A0A225DIH2_9BACT|nr:hypothetical protein FRUB_04685 [Fimbriiglobus ruber]